MSPEYLCDGIAAQLGRPIPWSKLRGGTELPRDAVITAQAGTFAQHLSDFRVAVVPDPLIDACVISGETPCIAFRVVACTRTVSPDYLPALRQLQRDMAFLMVKGRPSPRELNWVRSRGLEVFRLDGESRERLTAWVELLLHRPLENPEEAVRGVVTDKSLPWRGDPYARYRALCEADGPLDEVEVEALKLVTHGKNVPILRQLTIFDEQPAPRAPEHLPRGVRAAPTAKPRLTLALLLDTHRLADISRQTTAVSHLLGELFNTEPVCTIELPANSARLPARSVNADWRSAMAQVATRPSWPAQNLFEIWKSAGLLPQATLDELNQRALDLCDELLLEGDAVFDVNPIALQALKNCS